MLDEGIELQRTNVVKELIENEKLFHRQMSYVSEILSNGQIPVPVSKSYLLDFITSATFFSYI